MLETLFGGILGGFIAFQIIYWLAWRSLKTERGQLKAEIEALIYENRHQHPAIILNKVQEHLK